MITVEMLKAAKWNAIVFGDGAGGSAFQQYGCADFPEASYVWSRASRKDKGTCQFFVGELEVPDLETMAEHINARRAQGG